MEGSNINNVPIIDNNYQHMFDNLANCRYLSVAKDYELEKAEFEFRQKMAKADLLLAFLREEDRKGDFLIKGGDRDRLIAELIDIPFELITNKENGK